MVAEATSKVAKASLSIASYIRNLSNVVEHVSAREEENSNQAESSPEIAVLKDGNDIRCGDGKERDDTKDGGCDGHNLHVVDWAAYSGLRSIGGDLAGDPGVDFGRQIEVYDAVSTHVQH